MIMFDKRYPKVFKHFSATDLGLIYDLVKICKNRVILQVIDPVYGTLTARIDSCIVSKMTCLNFNIKEEEVPGQILEERLFFIPFRVLWEPFTRTRCLRPVK